MNIINLVYRIVPKEFSLTFSQTKHTREFETEINGELELEIDEKNKSYSLVLQIFKRGVLHIIISGQMFNSIRSMNFESMTSKKQIKDSHYKNIFVKVI